MTRVYIERDDDLTRVLVFCRGDETGGCSDRHDFVVLGYVPSQIVSSTAFIDVGFPLLQSQQFLYDDQRLISDIFEELADQRQLRELCLTALGISALSILANLPMASPATAQLTSQHGQAELDALLDFVSLSGVENPFSLPDTRPLDGLLVSDDVEAAGRGVGIFEPEEMTIEPAISVSEVCSGNMSAIGTCHRMRLIEQRFGYRFSESLADIDIDLASRALGAVRTPSPASVCFYGGTDKARARNRLQASGAYPLLANYIVEFEEARTAIDEGLPLRPFVQELTGLTAGRLKRLARISPTCHPADAIEPASDQQTEIIDFGDNRGRLYDVGTEPSEVQLIRILKQLDTAWIPDNRDDWDRFTDIVSTCVLPFGMRFNLTDKMLLAPAGGRWQAFHSSLASAAQMPVETFDRQHMAFAAGDALEAIDSFATTVLVPRILQSIQSAGEPCPPVTPGTLNRAARVSFGILRGNSKNLAGLLLGIGRRWMPRIPSLTLAAYPDDHQQAPFKPGADKTLQGDWPGLAADFEASNGLVVRNLVTASQLKRESRRLDHCVGSLYVRSAKGGRCHLFSVQDRSGDKSLSTFEVSPPVSSNLTAVLATLKIIQHKGNSNSPPPRLARLACNEWIKAVRNGQHTLNIEEVIEWQEAIRGRKKGRQDINFSLPPAEVWKAVLGTSWNEQATRNAVWQEWTTHILRKPLARGEDAGILLRNQAAYSLLRRWSPRAADILSARV